MPIIFMWRNNMQVFNIEYTYTDEGALLSEHILTLDRNPSKDDKDRILEIIKERVDMHIHDFCILKEELDELLEFGVSDKFVITPTKVHSLG